MNSWTFSIVPVFVRFALWLLSFTPSERVALGGAFLVFLGVLGEEVAEIKYLDEKNREGLKKNIKRWTIGILLMGLGFDAVGIVMSQAEMAALITRPVLRLLQRTRPSRMRRKLKKMRWERSA